MPKAKATETEELATENDENDQPEIGMSLPIGFEGTVDVPLKESGGLDTDHPILRGTFFADTADGRRVSAEWDASGLAKRKVARGIVGALLAQYFAANVKKA